MTLYQGGKKRIGKKIHDIISIVDENLCPRLRPYFEPFIGMAGVMNHFAKENERMLYASDMNKDLILMWKAIQKDWKPPLKVSKKKFEELKESKTHSAERAFVGIVASWGGVWFNNYRLDYQPAGKNYVKEGYDGLMKIKPVMKNVKFSGPASYDSYAPKGMLIYCDPPYQGNNLKSGFFTDFDHDRFWDTMRKWSKTNTVIISETTAPKDFKKLWCVESYTTNQNRHKVYQDCLFIHKDLYDKIDPKVKREIKNY
jgi:site-specific DNA-adenine methylase